MEPSGDVAMVWLVPVPTATNSEPFQAMPLPLVENIVKPKPYQSTPSNDVAIVSVGPAPTAIHKSVVG